MYQNRDSQSHQDPGSWTLRLSGIQCLGKVLRYAFWSDLFNTFFGCPSPFEPGLIVGVYLFIACISSWRLHFDSHIFEAFLSEDVSNPGVIHSPGKGGQSMAQGVRLRDPQWRFRSSHKGITKSPISVPPSWRCIAPAHGNRSKGSLPYGHFLAT